MVKRNLSVHAALAFPGREAPRRGLDAGLVFGDHESLLLDSPREVCIGRWVDPIGAGGLQSLSREEPGAHCDFAPQAHAADQHVAAGGHLGCA
jgi:hypothetical protein